ncbi:MAG: hypothetical protein J6D53_05585 [Blautia sp.]|nr:hypothetical protein [Blautia sp.]
MNRIRAKLTSNAGESIGETLVALLIASLALVMLAGAISSGARVILRSEKKVDEYYLENNKISSMEGSTEQLTVKIKTKTGDGPGEEVSLTGNDSPVSANAYTNSVFENKKVIYYNYSGG